MSHTLCCRVLLSAFSLLIGDAETDRDRDDDGHCDGDSESNIVTLGEVSIASDANGSTLNDCVTSEGIGDGADAGAH